METKNILIILSALFLMLTLLGCVEEPSPSTTCRVQADGCSPSSVDCCNGLKAVPFAIVEENGECSFAQCGDICLPCGDGICGEQENQCNCPEDCVAKQQPLEQVVGPEYYDSEQVAFDALNQELDQMEDLSTQELESMLGE